MLMQPSTDAVSLLPAQVLRILLVEDEPALARNVVDYLQLCGHHVDYAADGKHGLFLALQHNFDVILLDLMLPRLDGLSVCRQLRTQGSRHIPVLMLTARDTLDEKTQGFYAGADDYLTKPFALAELALRCQALARRSQPDAYTLDIGPLGIDRRSHQAWRAGQLLQLHPLGFQILLMLAEASPAVLSRQQLSERLWPDDAPDSDALRSHIYLLRQQLDKPFDWPLLHTVHGVGFVLRVSESV
ncbi:MAG: response regulator transcription factor [Pseudohongiella sp.]|nr:response regulator transcription factor [Pseudohongiella sp.]